MRPTYRPTPSSLALPVALVLTGQLVWGCGSAPPPPPAPPPATPAPAPQASPAPAAEQALALTYPATRKEPTVDTLHGVQVPDPYRWLEDDKAKEVKDWMGAQDALTRSTLGRLPDRDAIANRLRELFYVDSISPPVRRGQ